MMSSGSPTVPLRVTGEIVEREHGKRGRSSLIRLDLLQPGSDTKGSRGGSGCRQNRSNCGTGPAMPRQLEAFQVLTEAYPALAK
jgi:hypothetical protein